MLMKRPRTFGLSVKYMEDFAGPRRLLATDVPYCLKSVVSVCLKRFMEIRIIRPINKVGKHVGY